MKYGESIKNATKAALSIWRNMINEIAEEYHVKETMPITNLIQKEIKAKINENIENEAEVKNNKNQPPPPLKKK